MTKVWQVFTNMSELWVKTAETLSVSL